MNARDYRSLVRRNWLVVVLTTVIGGVVAGVLTSMATPLYYSQSTLYIAPISGDSATDLNQGASYIQSQILSLAQLATTSSVVSPVIDQLDLDGSVRQVASRWEVTTPANTSIVQIGVTDHSAATAADIANAAAESLRAYVNRIAPESSGRDPVIIARIAELGVEAASPSSPRLRLNLAAGTLLGLLTGTLVVVLRERLDTRIRAAADVAAVTAIPLLTSLPPLNARPGLTSLQWLKSLQSLQSLLRLKSPADDDSAPAGSSQGHRQLGAAIQAALGHPTRFRIVVAPVGQDESASAIVQGLADALEESGSAVLVSDTASPDADHDIVLVGSAAVLESADAALASGRLDGVVVLARAGTVRRNQLADALQLLQNAGRTVIGVALTNDRDSPYR